MLKDDLIRFRDMLDAAEEALQITAGKTQADLLNDRVLSLAVVKLVEIIGEAASRITEQTRLQHPSIEWRGIVAMRNRLIHAYASIDITIVWDTVSKDLPPLMSEVRRIVAAEGPAP